MARKNNRANVQRRRPRAAAQRPDYLTPKIHKHIPPVDVERMVVPTGRCGKKLRFGTPEEAESALRQAQQNRARFGNSAQECRYYSCQRCSGYHLTSRERFEQRPNP